MIKNIILALFICCLCTSCIDKHFKIYNLSGELAENINLNKSSSNFDQFQLYFDKSKIDKNYEEVNLIATDYYYYGQFFFDENFMEMIKIKTLDIGADALIYENKRKDFPNYDNRYLYFTAIRFKNK